MEFIVTLAVFHSFWSTCLFLDDCLKATQATRCTFEITFTPVFTNPEPNFRVQSLYCYYDSSPCVQPTVLFTFSCLGGGGFWNAYRGGEQRLVGWIQVELSMHVYSRTCRHSWIHVIIRIAWSPGYQGILRHICSVSVYLKHAIDWEDNKLVLKYILRMSCNDPFYPT